MNRNTIVAFALILATFLFFQSDMYYKLIGRPNPAKVRQTETQADSLNQVKQAESPTVLPAVAEMPTAAAVTVPTPVVGVDSSAGDTIWVETERLRVGIAERGAQIISLQAQEYSYRRGKKGNAIDEAIQLIPAGSTFGGAVTIVDKDDLSTRLFNYAGGRTVRITGDDTVSLAFEGTTTRGLAITKTYSFVCSSFVFGLKLKSGEIAGRNVTFGWPCGIDESEWKSGDKSITYDPRKAHVFDGSDIEHIHMSKPGEEERSGRYRWVGITSKYFLVAMLGGQDRDVDVSVRAFEDSISIALKKKEIGNHSFTATSTADGPEVSYRIYAGPMKLGDLRDEGEKLEKVLYGGWRWFLFADKWFPAICEFVLMLLIATHVGVRDYGISIILLTILVKLVTYPLSLSSMRSMSRMRDLQPKVNVLRQKFKADPRKMNEELMGLYRKEGVSPFNFGCLPMFLQMPVLFSLYVVLRKAIELRGAGTWVVPWVHDLSQAEVLFRLPFEIPFYGDNFALMPVVMAVVTFAQNKMTIKDPNQIAMVYLMPVMMLVMFNSFPAGLVLYWTLSSGLGLVQQKVMDKMNEKKTVEVAVVDSGRSERHRGERQK